MTNGRARKGSTPSGKQRKRKARTKDRYAHAREDAQLEGLIPTSPEESLTSERVPSSIQTEQPLPNLIAEAVRNGWSVPEGRKPGLVDELTAIIDNPEMPAKVKVAAFNALRQADQSQWERDHPKEKETSQGPLTLNVNVVTVNDSSQQDDTGLRQTTPVLGE